MKIKNLDKYILTVIFALWIMVVFFMSGTFGYVIGMAKMLLHSEDSSVQMQAFETSYSAGVFGRDTLLDFNGFVAKLIGNRSFYGDRGVLVTSDGYIVNTYDYTSCDYEVEQTIKFKSELDKLGVKLLYVNEPIRYIDDDEMLKEFGKMSYSNSNMDRFLERIGQAGVEYLDIRECIKRDGINPKEMFYRTDHHWTNEGALYCVRKTAQALNEKFSCNIDLNLYDDENFIRKEYPDSWLGDQGKLVSKAYVGLEDYTLLLPKYDTSYTFKGFDKEETFEGFINYEILNAKGSVYDNYSQYYSYNMRNCVNNNINGPKVLLLGDSYQQVGQPLLSLGISNMDLVSLRDTPVGFDLMEIVKIGEYDIVLIAYAQMDLGAHDQPGSINYNMYSFVRE